MSIIVSAGLSGVSAAIIGQIFAARLKKIEKLNSEKLEEMRDLLARQRDTRQAQIDFGRFATEKALETEFKALQDIHASLVRLDIAHYAVRPFFDYRPKNETEEQEAVRFEVRRQILIAALRETQTVLYTSWLFLPEELYSQLEASVQPARNELADISSHEEGRYESAGYDRAAKIYEKSGALRQAARKALRARLEELKRLPD